MQLDLLLIDGQVFGGMDTAVINNYAVFEVMIFAVLMVIWTEPAYFESMGLSLEEIGVVSGCEAYVNIDCFSKRNLSNAPGKKSFLG